MKKQPVLDCFFVALKCRMCEFFRTFRFSRFFYVSFCKSSMFRFAGFISQKTFGDIEKIYNFVTIKTNRPVATGFTVVYRAGLKVTKNE